MEEGKDVARGCASAEEKFEETMHGGESGG
jgi:hypothetical protein